MYLCNHHRLDLHLEGTPDPPQEVVAAALTAWGHGEYLAPDFKVAAPAVAQGTGTQTGTGTTTQTGTGTGTQAPPAPPEPAPAPRHRP